jgi:hypothetical protein
MVTGCALSTTVTTSGTTRLLSTTVAKAAIVKLSRPDGMTKLAAAIVCTVAALTSVPLAAHHSFSATYDDRSLVTIEGEVIAVVLRNPHSFVQVAVKATGKPETRYAVEWQSSGVLGEQGVTGQTFKSGDRVVISGRPSRTPSEPRLRMTMLRRPSDGFVWRQPPGEMR